MDNEVAEKLKAWGLEECIPSFIENGVDIDAFNLLDKELIKELIPRIGLRAKFVGKYEEEKKIDEVLPNLSINLTENEVEELVGSSMKRKLSIDKTDKEDRDSSIPSLVEPPLKRPKIDSPTIVQTESLFPNGLKAFLEGTTDGQIVLSNRHKITEPIRRKLTKIIVDHLFRNYRNKKTISSHIFIRACDEIVAEFPGENRAIYYVGYKPKTASAPRTLACGKLWSKYVNYNRNLSVPKEEEATSSDKAVPTEKGQLTSFEFLKNNLDPLEKIVEAWNNTSKLREDFRSKQSIQKYYDELPILKTQVGYTLLTTDFERLHKAETNALYESWGTLSKTIVKVGIGRELLTSTEANELSDAEILGLLSQLFPASAAGRKKFKGGKTSKEEARKSFFLHVENSGKIEEEFEKKRARLLKEGATMQPFILGIGPIHDLKEIYVIVDNIKYKMASTVQALDVCFKTFFALDASYPFDCQNIWTFIQQYIYKISTPKDISIVGVATLIADLERAQNEEDKENLQNQANETEEADVV